MTLRKAASVGLVLLTAMSANAARAQTFTLSGPDLAAGGSVMVTDEASVTVQATWAPDGAGSQDDGRFTGRFDSRTVRKVAREVTFESAISTAVRYTSIEPAPGSEGEGGIDQGLRSALLSGSYRVQTVADSVRVTVVADDSVPSDATARFLRGDFLGLLAWRSLRSAIPAGGLARGESIELAGGSALGLLGTTLPLARRTVLTLQQVPTAGQSAVFDLVANLEPEPGSAEGRLLRGTAKIDPTVTQIEIQLFEEHSETTPIEFTDRRAVSMFQREIKIRRTIREVGAGAAGPS